MNKAIIFFLMCSFLPAAEKLRLDDAGKLPSKAVLDACFDPVVGKKLSLVWRGAALDAVKGFKTPSGVAWKASVRDSDLEGLLKVGLLSLKGRGSYTLELAVLEVGDRSGVFDKAHYFILEGRVLQADGAPVASFLTKEKQEQDGQGGWTFKPGVDRAFSAITSELFKAGSPTAMNRNGW